MKPISSPHALPTGTPATENSGGRRFLESGTGNWLAALLVIGVPFIGANILTKLFWLDPGSRDLRNLFKVLVIVAAYAAYVRGWERRPVRELSLSGAVPELLAGLFLGSFLFSAVLAILAASGAYSLQAIGAWKDVVAVTTSMLPKLFAGALIEEVIFRLLVLRLVERSFGTAWALGISSLLFGIAHLGNARATPLNSLMLGLGPGLLLGSAYLVSRKVWLCTALHTAWNFTQGAVFSLAVSGQSGEGWLHGDLSGPLWLTGGPFGPEGSVVSLLICSAVAGILLMVACRNGRLVTTHPRRRPA